MGTLVEPLYDIREPAGWVDRREVSLADESRHADAPCFFLLVDYQENVRNDRIESYTHTVEKINDSSRIEDASLYLRELHPDGERVIFHGADIIRNGERFSALDPENLEVYRRETSLESHITNQRQTISLSIDDLRVGDLLDFRVTITRRATAHPLWVKHFFTTFWLTWNCPVVRQVIRIVNRSDRSLNLHHHRIDEGRPLDDFALLKPRQEFEREYHELLPKRLANTAPAWWWSDCLQVTRDQTWQQVSRHLHRYYSEIGVLDCQIDIDSVDRIELNGDRRKDALRIIRFVQNEIRYRGQNHGIYSHTPKSPQLVLIKGAGDCKDKSNLLRALLEAIGVESSLVLVNTDYGKSLGELKPSAQHFNHMIVRVSIDGADTYYDPTVQKQAGNFEHAAELDYGFALGLNEDGEDLVRLPFDISRKVFVLKHIFDFRTGGHNGGTLSITRKYMAHRADDVRHRFASQNLQRLQEQYLENTRDDTELELKVISPVAVVKDDRDRNILVTREKYRISNLETTHGDERIELATRFYRSFPEPSDTRFPAQITAPGAGEHHIEIHYPVKPDVACSAKNFENSVFAYKDRVWLEGNVLRFQTLITPYREIVDRGELSQYKSDVIKMANRSLNRFPWRVEAEADEDECLRQLNKTTRNVLIWNVGLIWFVCLSLLLWAIL